MKTTAELLAESRSLRFSFTKPDTVAESLTQTYVQPLPWNYYYGQVLGAVGSSMWWHVYFDELPLRYTNEIPDGMTVIIHGHSGDEHCVTKTLCHVLGYKPNGENLTEIQKKNWRKFGYGEC